MGKMIKRKNWNKNTSKRWKVIGNAFLAVFAMSGTITAVFDHEYIGICLVACGAIGKFLTELTTDE